MDFFPLSFKFVDKSSIHTSHSLSPLIVKEIVANTFDILPVIPNGNVNSCQSVVDTNVVRLVDLEYSVPFIVYQIIASIVTFWYEAFECLINPFSKFSLPV